MIFSLSAICKCIRQTLEESNGWGFYIYVLRNSYFERYQIDQAQGRCQLDPHRGVMEVKIRPGKRQEGETTWLGLLSQVTAQNNVSI